MTPQPVGPVPVIKAHFSERNFLYPLNGGICIMEKTNFEAAFDEVLIHHNNKAAVSQEHPFKLLT